MGDHEDGLVSTSEKSFKPFNHLEVEVVCWLVENKEVRVCHKNSRKGYAFLLTTRELSHRLVEVAYLQLCENLLCVEMVLMFCLVFRTSVYNRFLWVEYRCLTKEACLDIVTIDYGALIDAFYAHEH